MLADFVKVSKLTSTKKNIVIGKLSGTLCSHQAKNLSKHIILLDTYKSNEFVSRITYTKSPWQLL